VDSCLSLCEREPFAERSATQRLLRPHRGACRIAWDGSYGSGRCAIGTRTFFGESRKETRFQSASSLWKDRPLSSGLWQSGGWNDDMIGHVRLPGRWRSPVRPRPISRRVTHGPSRASKRVLVHQWTDARKTLQNLPLPATFRPARRGPDESGLDPQVVFCELDRIGGAVFIGDEDNGWHRPPPRKLPKRRRSMYTI
jgi:hypothetical protein